jgi:nucleotide-binding universal stress UspA family protein
VTVVVAYPAIGAGGALLEVGAVQAARAQTDVLLLHHMQVIAPADRRQADRQERKIRHTRQFLESVADGLRQDGVRCRVAVVTGRSPEPSRRLLVKVWDEKPDLLVIGAHARPGRPVGKTAQDLIAGAGCPVLAVPLPVARSSKEPNGG